MRVLQAALWYNGILWVLNFASTRVGPSAPPVVDTARAWGHAWAPLNAGPCRGGADPGWHLQTLSAVQAPWLEHSGEKSALKSYLHMIDGSMDRWSRGWMDR